ncbi:MAG: Type 1 glutamine amidotransferase-like domain-containing protein, partial [Acidimicrobiales bacterium]
MVHAYGPVALAGSGEFLPVMESVDRALLQGGPNRAAFLPTAAALEGDARVAYWLDLGRRHYEQMGVEPVPVPVRTRADAEDPDIAALVRDVGLVYLSGGDPHHLAATLRGSAVWDAIVEVWRGGAALAGCSAGAMALTAGAPALGSASDVAAGVANGLGVLPGISVIPHFDMMERWRAGAVDRFLAWRPPGTVLVGLDEDTALVGDGQGWRVEGRGAAWLFEGAGRRRFGPGEAVPLPAP